MTLEIMQKLIKKLLLIICFSIPFFLMAQNPPHPNGGSGPTGGNTPVGGGAPLGSGLVLMMVLGSAYAAKKTFFVKKEK